MKNLVKVEIRAMSPGDLEKVLEIEHLSYPTPWSRRAFQSEITQNVYAHYFVAEYGQGMAGYFGMWIILDEAHITNIAVNPSLRRQGIGEQMLRFSFEKAKELGACRMTLEVRVSNSQAKNLYSKLGFVERGIRKGYYTDTNEDAIIMWKDDLGPGSPPPCGVKWML